MRIGRKLSEEAKRRQGTIEMKCDDLIQNEYSLNLMSALVGGLCFCS